MAIQRNSIYGNGGLGIDLGNDGVTANDAGDGDTGANGLQNYPVLTLAQPVSGNATRVTGSLDSAPNTSYRIDFYDNAACPAGNGQGKAWIGWAQQSTDANGHLDIDTGTGLTAGGVSVGDAITATATDPNGNTSEFSGCQTVSSPAGLSNVNFTGTAAVDAGAQTVPTGSIDLSALSQGNGTTSGTALGGIPIERMALGGIALGGIALGGIGITPQLLNSTLGGVHLADIPLNQTGGWPAYLASVPALAPLAGRPLDSVTLSDVLTLNPASASSVHIGDVDLSHTALGGIALGGIALGPLTLSQIPLRTGATTAAQNAADWCAAIRSVPGFTCSPSDGTAIANDTLITWALRGLPLDQIQLPNGQTGLDGAPLAGHTSTGTTAGVALGGIALGGIALGGIDLHGTALGGIALGGIALGGIGTQGTALGGIALGGIHLPQSSLQGTALGGIALGGINFQSTALGGIALGGIALGGINLQSSALGGIALGGIAPGVLEPARRLLEQLLRRYVQDARPGAA